MGSKKLAKLAKITLNVGAGFMWVAVGVYFAGGSKGVVLVCMVVGLLWVAFGVGVVWADSYEYPRTKPSLLRRLLNRISESEK